MRKKQKPEREKKGPSDTERRRKRTINIRSRGGKKGKRRLEHT